MSPVLTRGQRVPTCFVLSKLLTTSDYKTRSLDLEWLLSILNTKVYQLHLDQMLEMLFIPFIVLMKSVASPLPFWSMV